MLNIQLFITPAGTTVNGKFKKIKNYFLVSSLRNKKSPQMHHEWSEDFLFDRKSCRKKEILAFGENVSMLRNSILRNSILRKKFLTSLS